MLRLLFFLPCLWSHGVGGESPPTPLHPRFVAETFHHVLHWDPPPSRPGPGLGSTAAPAAERLLYEVQYWRYGNSSHWTPVPSCMGIACCTCDLSYETREPGKRYHTRVRAVADPHWASEWVHAPTFRPEEASLWLSSMSLTIRNGTIHLSIQLPISPWDNITYEDLHPQSRQYHAYVRSVSSGIQLVHVGTSTEFDLPALARGEHYCVSVEPRISSRELPANRTEEQCISLPALEEDHTRVALLGPSMALLSLPILGALLISLALAWAYVKKPTKALPGVLKSVLKGRSPQVQHQLPQPGTREAVVLKVERDPVQHLSILGPKEQTSTDQPRTWGAGSVPWLLEKHCWGLAWPVEAGTGMRRGLEDSSIGGSTDSGICLQDPLGSLGQLLSLGSSQEGGSLEACDDVGGEVETARGALEPKDAPHGGSSGYQKQAAAPCGPPLGTEETGYPKAGLVTSYLKQASLGVALGAAAEQGLSRQKGSGESGLPSWQDPRGPGGLEAAPRVPCDPPCLGLL